MSDQIWHQLGEATRVLFLGWVIFMAYNLTKRSANSRGRSKAIIQGLLWCCGLAAFAALTLGQASCADSDALSGGCLNQNDDGYLPTNAQRVGTFVFWALVLNVPMLIGGLSANPESGRRHVFTHRDAPDRDT